MKTVVYNFHEEQEQLSRITFMKVIMIVLVVLGHSCIVYQGKGWGGTSTEKCELLAAFVDIIATFHTYFLVFASGYLFSYNRYRLNKYRNWNHDFIGKVKRLIVPYVLFAFVWAAPIDYFVKGEDIASLLKHYFLGFNCAQLWYLIMLFGEWLIFYFTSDYMLKIPTPIVMVSLIALRLLCVLGEKYFPLGVLDINNICRYAIVYYMGILFCIKRVKISDYLKGLILGEIFILGISFLMKIHISNVYIMETINTLSSIQGVMLVYSIGQSIHDKKLIKWINVRLAKYGMGIYLIHQQIIYIILKLVDVDVVNPYIFTLFCFTLSIMISYYSTKYFVRFKIGRLFL